MRPSRSAPVAGAIRSGLVFFDRLSRRARTISHRRHCIQRRSAAAARLQLASIVAGEHRLSSVNVQLNPETVLARLVGALIVGDRGC